jgi:hypothetical protein
MTQQVLVLPTLSNSNTILTSNGISSPPITISNINTISVNSVVNTAVTPVSVSANLTYNILSDDTLQPTLISPFIAKDFPLVYQENSPMFVQFLKSYFQWLEQPGNIVNKIKTLKVYKDIDTTDITRYYNTYLPGVPNTVACNPRLLIKHVLDLYNTKGTKKSFDIFFRAFFNTPVDIYLPSSDIIKPSDSKWNIDTYIEVEFLETLDSKISYIDYIGKQIKGLISGATAVVESFERKFITNKLINVFYISNLRGNFVTSERIYCNALNQNTAFTNLPYITGSLTTSTITSGGRDYNVGDVLSVVGSGSGGLARVVSTVSGDGKVTFTLLDGGFGYTVNAQITLANQTGTGASFTIGGLTNTSILYLNTDFIAPHTSQNLNASNWSSFAVPTANLNSVLSSVLQYSNVTIGTITFLSNINPGENYTLPPIVSIYEPLIAPLYIPDGRGGIWGNDAIVNTAASLSNGVITAIQITDSGFGYEPGEQLIFTPLQSNGTINATGIAVVQNQGKSTGYWTKTNSHLDTNKYIQDSYYYQQYSYEIQTPVDKSQVDGAVVKLLHPAGMEKFYKFKYSDNQNLSANIIVNYTINTGNIVANTTVADWYTMLFSGF